MRVYQTTNDLTDYCTDDPAATYETKQNDDQNGDEIKQRNEFVPKSPRQG